MSFAKFELDNRIEQAIAQLGYTEPTPIQETSIPLALKEKKDIVAKARTGSGKTAAYLIPILQNMLTTARPGNRCLIVVPSRELADQVVRVLSGLTMFCSRQISYANVAQQVADKVKATLLADSPSIIVATPSSARAQIEAGHIDTEGIEFVVFDEADLLVSYGYEEDLEVLKNRLPEHAQSWLMSATLGDDVENLKKWFCRMPVTLKLQDTSSQDQLLQYYVKTGELDKFLLAYVIFKLNLIKGKTIIFVNDTDRCYRLKLFFEQFGIKSCVLNSELPVASRLHIVQEFNRNVYNLLIATDESHESDADQEANTTQQAAKDGDYGVSRGVDFKNVACVVNFDLPTSSKAYTHRIGRTARANRAGMALSFVVPREEFGKHKVATTPTSRRDEKILDRIMRAQTKMGNQVSPYQFDMKQVESFRYRMEDAFRAVTRVAVREARVKEIKNEILASDKLQRHFEENPDDLAALRHDKELHPARVQTQLKRVPDYLLPASARVTKPLFVQQRIPFHKQRRGKKLDRKKGRKGKDPLKSFGR